MWGGCGLLDALDRIEHFVRPPDPPVIEPPIVHLPDFCDIIGSLLREGIAGRLNVSCPDIDYHVSGGHVTEIVNNALHSGDRDTIIGATHSLRNWNSVGFHH